MTLRHLGVIWLAGSIVSASVIAQPSDSDTRPIASPRPIAAEPVEAEPIRAAPTRTRRPTQRLSPGVETAPVDSVAEHLQRIVVLCATEPGSDELEAEWTRYVEQQAVAAEDLDALIEDVLARAEAYRAERSPRPRSRQTILTTTSTQKMLHDTAMAIIRKIG